MNDKLTIQELAAYLPWDVEMIFEGKGGRRGVLQTIGTSKLGDTISIGNGAMWLKSCGFKPLLLPLSTVTTEFCKIHNIEFTHRFWGDMNFNKGSDKEGCSDYFTFKDAQILAKHHVDLFNLIPRGIAIDKTTIL